MLEETTGASAWSLIFTGNWVALAIYGVLLAMSAVSWAVIVVKWIYLRRVQTENSHFYQVFLRNQPLGDLHKLAQKFPLSPMARMFEVSYREIASFRDQMDKPGEVQAPRERLMQALSRTLERVFNQHDAYMVHRLPFLATVSGSAPFIGLFGTVLGIIDAFRNIGLSGVTSLAIVAPGISEALVATAAGLLAAIPALIAYNVYRSRIREINVQGKNFALEVTNRFERIL